MPAAGESWYRFRHALVRDAVYESVSPSRRAHWHAAVVELMEQRLGARVEEHAADLAYHAARAEALVGSSRVVKYSRLAGERMLATHAFDEASRHFERAWRARNSVPCDDEAAGILAGLGLAQAATTVRWNRQEAGPTCGGRSSTTSRQARSKGRRGSDARVARRRGRGGRHRRHPPAAAVGQRRLARSRVAARPRGGGRVFRDRERPTDAAMVRARARDRFVARGCRARTAGARPVSSVDHFALRWHDALVKSRRVLELAGRVDELHSAHTRAIAPHTS